jgi:hypothetical protein
MTFRIGRRPLAALLAVPLLAGAVEWAVTQNGPSIRNAEPAGERHVTDAAAAAPDDRTEDAAAGNFTQVKFMMRGYCYAASQAEDSKAMGGYGKCSNFARRVRADSKGKGLFLLAQPGVSVRSANPPGMRVVLVNQTEDMLAFSASDSRLEIVQEARDPNGDWRAIEYLPSSWCGNSFHRVFLLPNYFWEFAAPRYQGPFSTQLRFRMKLADGSLLHSNVFEGSVHPEQFTTEQGHRPTEIMDSYDD